MLGRYPLSAKINAPSIGRACRRICESSHAIAHACRLAPSLSRDAILLVNLSGRGDKDVISVQAALEGGR